jgi:hypothetical protein
MTLSLRASWLIATLLVFTMLAGALWWADTSRVDERWWYETGYDRRIGGQP